MTDNTPKSETRPAAPPDERTARAERLAAQLKANLKRRKAQARGRAEAGKDDAES